MAYYRKTKRRNKPVLLPRIRRLPGRIRVKDLRRLPWWADLRVMQIVDGKAREATVNDFTVDERVGLDGKVRR